MRKFKDYDTTQSYKQADQLPIGGYILKIKNAEIQPGRDDYPDTLVISFDIAEGPFKDFYMKNWKNQDGENKKWKGVFRLRVPNDDGSEYDDWRKRSFKTAMECIEDSNEGYAWDWNESGLKGLKVGGIFNKKEYDFEGRHGFFTQCKRFDTVERIVEGTFKQPDTDYLKGHAPADLEDDGFLSVSDAVTEQLPFA